TLIEALDLATSHRMSPHEDAPLTKARAIANLVRCVKDEVRPLKAWVRVPVLLPGERACPRDEPARSIYGRLTAIEAKAGIIDAAVWIGYAWADEPRCSAAIVVSGTDRDAILREARALAESYWDARADFSFSVPAGDADWCIVSSAMVQSAATSPSSRRAEFGRSSRRGAGLITTFTTFSRLVSTPRAMTSRS